MVEEEEDHHSQGTFRKLAGVGEDPTTRSDPNLVLNEKNIEMLENN